MKFTEKLDKAMNNKTYDEFSHLVDEALKEHKEWRLGQTMFNVLEAYDYTLASKVRGSPLDPFHTKSMDVIQKFGLYVKAHWEPILEIEDDK